MFPCEIKEQPAQHILAIRFRSAVQDLPKHLGRVYSNIGQYLGTLGEQPAGGVFAAYYNMDVHDFDVAAGFTVSRALPGKGEIHVGEIPAGVVAICHYTGPYDKLNIPYGQLMQFITGKGYTISGPAYEWYLNGPETPPQDLKTDIVIPVVPAEEKVRG